MKIAHVAPYYYPFKGGVETYLKGLSEALVKQGHEVEVFCANIPKGKQHEMINGVHVHRLVPLGRVSYLPILPTLLWQLLKSKADVYHLHIAPPLLPEIGLLAARLKGKRTVLTYHNDVIASGFLGAAAALYNHTVLGLLLSGVDRIIVHTSKYLQSSPYLPRYSHKASVIPSGVDLRRFSTGNRKHAKKWLGISGRVILFVGSLNPKHRYKGVDLLISAMPAVREKEKDARLVIVGEGELKKEYEALANQLGLGDCVRFEGFVEDKLLPSYYKAADVLALPSTNAQEGWGLAAIEALACGTPAVVSARAGVSEAITAEAGAIAKANDVDDLASKLLETLAKKHDPEKLHAFAEKFSWDNIARETLKAYESAQ